MCQLRRFFLCQAAGELLVTRIRLLLRRVVAALPGLVVVAHLEVAEAAELLHLLAAATAVVVHPAVVAALRLR